MNDTEENPMGKLDPTEEHQYDCAIHAAFEHFGIPEHVGQG